MGVKLKILFSLSNTGFEKYGKLEFDSVVSEMIKLLDKILNIKN